MNPKAQQAYEAVRDELDAACEKLDSNQYREVLENLIDTAKMRIEGIEDDAKD